MVAVICLNISIISTAQTVEDTTKKWTNHFQLTVVSQSHPGFKSLYSGTNSLADSVETGATTITSTLFIGRKLWKGAAFYFNPEISGGGGLSSTLGVAGALNGESYRVGNPHPSVFIARAYLQQHIPLGNTSYESVEDGVNQVADKIPSSRITITAGKFANSDFYDNNKYSHDPRTQFLNWSLMSNGSWDYPANTRGYTKGLIVELIKPTWALRLSSVQVPAIANAPKLEYDITKAHSETLEIERNLTLAKHPGVVRLGFSNTYSRAPSYKSGLNAIGTGDKSLTDVISGNAEGTTYGGKKFGVFAGLEQEITKDIGFFARAGYNDGKYATWAFTEIDRTAHAGLLIKGTSWKRSEDVFGIAGVVNGISQEHRDFLKSGGYGFIIGDGMLNYGKEAIIETFYNAHLSNFFWLTLDYQFVQNPAYNKDRGPVHVFGIRGHIEL